MSRKPVHALIAASLVALSLGACQVQVAGTVAPGVSPAPGTSPAPATSASPAAGLAINGLWMTGGEADPEPAGPYMTTFTCPEGGNAAPTPQIPRDDRNRAWQVTHAGDDVTVASLYDQGVGPTGPAPHCPERKTAARGTYKAGKLALTGTFGQDVAPCAGYWNPSPWPIPASTSEAVTWDLTFDEATGHLRGTRNGKRFWMAPVKDPAGSPTPCPPMPVS